MSGPITEIPKGVEMFPDPATVFADPVDGHAELLFPIFSIDLALVEPSWSGKVHMLLFNYDPYNAATTRTFTAYCKDNSLGFDVLDDTYRFQADLAFFDRTEDWEKWFVRTKDLYRAARDHFRSSGTLPPRWDEPVPFIDRLGGAPEWIQDDATPMDPDGAPMRFIAQVSSWNYADDMCGRVLYLFYSHRHKLAVIVDQCD